MKKLLAVFAHPDDESFASGGTIAKYVKAGWQADIICATQEFKSTELTSGVMSKFSDDPRQKELKDAAAQLGVHAVTFMEYESGKLAQQTPGEIEDKLLHVFADVRPDVVMAFDPTGVTNDPDHTKLTLATTFAFQQYAWVRHDEQSDIELPPRLYFACIPESVVSYLQKSEVIPTELFGKPLDGVPDRKITHVIDIKRFAAIKSRALSAHTISGEQMNQWLGTPHNPLFTQEYFVLRMEGLTEVFMGKNDRVSDRL